MPKTLRGRLLISYIAVIVTVLVLTAVALFVITTTPKVRWAWDLQRLATLSQSTRQFFATDTTPLARGRVEQVLSRVATDNGVRTLLVDKRGNVLYDSEQTQPWATLTANDVVSRPAFTAPDGGLTGSYRAPNGGNWLVYANPLPLNGQIWHVVYAVREPGPLLFFRQYFLSPLCGAGLVAFFLSLLLVWQIAGSVGRPLSQMAVTADKITQGDYNQTLNLEGPIEVHQLATAFNGMVEQIRASHQTQRDFVANVSHDLKTPLTSIKGWSQALLDGTAVTPEEQQRAANIIHNEADRMSGLVGQLLDLARLESGQFHLAIQAVDLGKLLTELQANLLPTAQEKGIYLTLEVSSLPSISGDPDRLMQIFTNLADNALAHTAAKGRVHLALRPHGEGAVEVLVQDTGKGIPSDQLTRIFERFYQVDRARKAGRQGSGLGLAIVKQLVEAHNGRIRAYSEVGKGSVFVVRLPTGKNVEATTLQQRYDFPPTSANL